MSSASIVALGDSCVALQLGTTIDPTVNAHCISVAEALGRQAITGVRDIVPTYNAVSVHFDPLETDRHLLETTLQASIQNRGQTPFLYGGERTIEIPVAYGGASGPDLRAVAEFAGCSEEEVVRLHTQPVYRVYMLGFLPGFAYMGPVDDRIAMPRLETPRMRVAAGSVGIAASQTGIYPFDSPGGWRIIGHTASRMFDAARGEPFLLKAGDCVRFRAR